MTTYTLTGFTTYWNEGEGNVGGDFTDITLEIVVPGSTSSLTYSPRVYGDEDDDFFVNATVADAYTSRLNGETLWNDDFIWQGGTETRELIIDVGWTDSGGVARNTVVLVIRNLEAVIPGHGTVDEAENVFRLSGDPLPTMTSLADVDDFLDSITTLDRPTGTFAPNTSIPLSNFAATVTENDLISGTVGADTFYSGQGNDKIHGFEGDDSLFGGSGHDRLNGGAGADFLNGGSGIDRAEYSLSETGVRADLRYANLNTGEASGDTYSSIENVLGSSYNDILGGNNGVNNLFGDIGNDYLTGRGGNDRLYGGDGHDRLNGGTGADLLNGGSGTDRAEYTTATESVRADLQYAGVNTGEAAGDRYSSVENLFGSGHADILGGNGGANTILGGNGNDVIIGRAGNDRLYGGNGHDRLNGGTGADLLNGGTGIDRADYSTASAGVRADIAYRGTNTGEAAGDSYVSIENLLGSSHNDTLAGNNAANTLLGGSGNDLLIGRGGNDRLYGGNGNDRLLGGTGENNLYGGRGADTFIFNDENGSSVIADFDVDQGDVMQINGANSMSDLTFTEGAGGLLIEYGSVSIIIDELLADVDASYFSF